VRGESLGMLVLGTPASAGCPGRLRRKLSYPSGTMFRMTSTQVHTSRREELGQFLKACRARIGPEEVGLPPGVRRRTSGLRREEVALLAGVGVTWYTWLEQGRPINASAQVLDAG